jgi:hypothetical protein
VLGRAGVTSSASTSPGEDEAALARRLEGALMHDPAITAAGGRDDPARCRPQGGATPARRPARPVNLSLISHTNAGKTTLVRPCWAATWARCATPAHVTEVASGYVMLQHGGDSHDAVGHAGFGDTARLLGG